MPTRLPALPGAMYITPVHEALSRERADRLQAGPAPVPCTSVFSRSENIEVMGSHLGMAWHPAVLYLVADRLAQPEGQWQPFAPPPWLASWYPAPSASLAEETIP